MIEQSKNWPDPTVQKTERTLKPIHVGKDGKRIVDSPKVQEAAE